jgi:hypothetical protein
MISDCNGQGQYAPHASAGSDHPGGFLTLLQCQTLWQIRCRPNVDANQKMSVQTLLNVQLRLGLCINTPSPSITPQCSLLYQQKQFCHK